MPETPAPAPLARLARMARLARTQAEAVAALPAAMLSLTRAVSSLEGTIREVRDTLARLQRLGDRLEGMVDVLEEPVKDLAPGLRRVGKILDDPTISEIPETVRRVRDDLLPLVATLRGTTDVLDRLSSARALLGGGRRRPEAPPVTPPVRPALEADPGEADAR